MEETRRIAEQIGEISRLEEIVGSVFVKLEGLYVLDILTCLLQKEYVHRKCQPDMTVHREIVMVSHF